ncbi:hypothetical protein NPIL_560941 [Nephila pilipes]|uniref:Uncharacterized protein n=1 Tax=Nephila pilipes TaxID=299642 RepID=A0A8X6NYR5_NEPPI|nr:hypothetical protein NPIL_560941 [Nephila pilipes]
MCPEHIHSLALAARRRRCCLPKGQQSLRVTHWQPVVAMPLEAKLIKYPIGARAAVACWSRTLFAICRFDRRPGADAQPALALHSRRWSRANCARDSNDH